MAEIPILIFHGVRDDPSAAPEKGVVRPETFDRQLEHLRRKGYESLTIGALLEHRAGVRTLPQRSVALTFDDATADHWHHVVPILRRHEMRATFFVPTERPEDGAPRETSVDTSPRGSMRWSELEQAAAGGLIEVESHSHYHARHIAGPRVLGFYRPDPERPETWGRPVYEDAPSLARPRFEPDADETEMLRAWVETHGGREFFDRSDWEDDLHRVVETHRANASGQGRFETQEAYRSRVLDELRLSRRTIEQRLGRQTRFMAWPYGGISLEAHELALEAGFRATVASTRLPAGPPATLFKRTHFGEDYRGPFESTIQLWRFVRTVETACEVGIRRRFSPLLRPFVRLVRRDGSRGQGGSEWRSR